MKAGALEIEIYHRGVPLVHYRRCYGSRQTFYRLEHYLYLLERRPGAVMNARPVRDAGLPQEIWSFAWALQEPDRGMVRLLIVDHGVDKVLSAVRRACEHHQLSVEVVAYYVTAGGAAEPLPIKGPAVPVDLARYDHLLAGGGAS